MKKRRGGITDMQALAIMGIGILCWVGQTLYGSYQYIRCEQATEAERVMTQQRAIQEHAWNESVYRATSEAVLHPTDGAFAELARQLPGGANSPGYRLVYLYARLDDPCAKHADRLQAWRQYDQNGVDLWHMEDTLRTTHPSIQEWVRVLRIDVRDPHLPRGVREALVDMYTLGAPRRVREVEQQL